jgi:hypothetical protein
MAHLGRAGRSRLCPLSEVLLPRRLLVSEAAYDPTRKSSMHRNNPENDDFQLVFSAPCQLPSLAGQEHGRTIPLCDISRIFDDLCLNSHAAS